MTIPHIFLALSFAGTLAAQTFIQMSITGDLINEGANAAQAAEYKRISAKLVSQWPGQGQGRYSPVVACLQ